MVKTASYRVSSDSKACGLSDDYSCKVDVTCLVKQQCDGQHECNITVDNNLVSSGQCNGLTKYLYFEYQCADDAISFNQQNLPICASDGPRVLPNMSSGDIKAKEGDLVSLLCSAQGKLPITFSWKKDRKLLKSFTVTDKRYRISFLVVKVKDETSFGKYICHMKDSFNSTNHTISVSKLEDSLDTCYKKYLMAIIFLAALLIILLVFLVYFICQNCRQKPLNTATNEDNHGYYNENSHRNNSAHSNDNSISTEDDNYEQVELDGEQSAYAALERSGEEETDDALYTHLNNIPQDCMNQEETEQDYVNTQENEQNYVIQQETGM